MPLLLLRMHAYKTANFVKSSIPIPEKQNKTLDYQIGYTFVSIALDSESWKCNFNLDLPSSEEPLNCENLYCQTGVFESPS